MAIGLATVSDIAAGSYKDAVISFGKTMPTKPSVVAMRAGAGSTGYDIVIATSGILTTGATIRVWNYGNSTISPIIQWIAVCG